MSQLYDKLETLHERAERRRLNGKKPTEPQIKKRMQRRAGRPRAWKKMLSIQPMQSARVIREITASMLPEKFELLTKTEGV